MELWKPTSIKIFSKVYKSYNNRFSLGFVSSKKQHKASVRRTEMWKQKGSEITAGFQDSLMTVMAKYLIAIPISISIPSLSVFLLTPISINGSI